MMDNDKEKPVDMALMEVRIREIVSKIKNDSSSGPEELEEIKKIIRKNVPFLMRSAFSAYLVREVLNSGYKKKERREERKTFSKERERSASPEKTESQEKTEEKKAIPEGAKTIYINVGKMKHLYAKNLSILIQNELGITRSDIYSIRIHDKYSFVTMSEENCVKAIEKLNGKEINGRVAEVMDVPRAGEPQGR